MLLFEAPSTAEVWADGYSSDGGENLDIARAGPPDTAPCDGLVKGNESAPPLYGQG